MKTSNKITIDWVELELNYDYTPGDPGVMYHPDGSGTPPSGPEIEINEVYWIKDEDTLIDITQLWDDYIEWKSTYNDNVRKTILMYEEDYSYMTKEDATRKLIGKVIQMVGMFKDDVISVMDSDKITQQEISNIIDAFIAKDVEYDDVAEMLDELTDESIFGPDPDWEHDDI